MATTAKSVILRDKDDGKQLLPMTRAELVIRNDGTSVETSLANKQDTLVSGTNIKTVNNESLLGSGNISVAGTPGEPGGDGVGIASIVQTTESTESGGTNVITVTKTDGTTSTFNVRNGDAVGTVPIVQTTGDSTTSAMSQDGTTKALADNKSHVLRVSPNSVFEGVLTQPDFVSQRVFPFSDIHSATAIFRPVSYKSASNSSRFDVGVLLGFYVSETTFLELIVESQKLRLYQYVNGTQIQMVEVGQQGDMVENYPDYAVSFDNDKKLFEVFAYDNNTETIVRTMYYDISSWDISSLTDVYLKTSANDYSACICCTTICINYPIDLADYLHKQINVGEFNNPQGTPYNDNLNVAGTGISAQGTTTTVSATDKIVSISYASETNYALDVSNQTTDYGWYHVRMDFSTVGSGAYITGGQAFGHIVIENGKSNVVHISSSSDKFYPVAGQTYDLYFQFNHSDSYGKQRNYGIRMFGDMTFEVTNPYIFNHQIQNLCAETYIGGSFAGAIPFNGDASFVPYEAISTSANFIRTPLYSMKIVSGVIYMWNGSVWKQINNS